MPEGLPQGPPQQMAKVAQVTLTITIKPKKQSKEPGPDSKEPPIELVATKETV